MARQDQRPESVPVKRAFTGREFQLWQFRVSHGELLVRSPKDSAHPHNVDLTFVGVTYVDLPRLLPDLDVDEPIDLDVERAEERLGKAIDRQDVFVLVSQGRRYLVVAAAANVAESDMSIFDSPFD